MGNSICFSQQQKMVAYFPSIWHSIMHICIIWVCQIIELSFRKETFLLLRLFAWTTEWLAKGRVSSNFRWKKTCLMEKNCFLTCPGTLPFMQMSAYCVRDNLSPDTNIKFKACPLPSLSTIFVYSSLNTPLVTGRGGGPVSIWHVCHLVPRGGPT